ncbi:signal recognition particle protein [Agathobaculum sp.]|uniref:signal recognition particle protein n=1 Tax=Agathobaculum sp. TaxID=2048138 RepID=UPI002A823521|nr:signal recognition particle protein [Agathobaculum sp.]MDY3618313.1 signal recognition particle protein [Agathobaculum sp.]
MAFEGLTEKISSAFKHLKSKGRLTEGDVKEAMREIRMALLEADVNFKVAKDFIKTVTEKATDAEILESLSPAQQVIKIVNEELTALLGGQNTRLTISPNPPTIVMMVGLQGAGKTTNCAKLAALMRKQQQRRPLLVACDVYRPAAIEQLHVVGKQLDIPVFDEGQGDPVEIAKHGVEHARKNGFDLVFLDTAGRLHIDEALMDELKNIKKTVKPTEIELVVDAMTGQDAVTVSQSFDEALGIDGVLLSKMDGDARGGAALSVKAVTGKPIKFIGTGEKLSDIEPFHPDRMSSRILGMGDVLTLIEKAQQNFDQKQAAETAKKMAAGKLTLTDFLGQLQQMKNMGSMEEMLGMLPGVDAKALAGAKIDEKQMAHTEAIIQSMTPKERDNPSVINFSRKKRIAAGCGLTVEEVNRLLKQFEAMQKMTKQLTGQMRGKGKKRRGFGGFGGMKMPF